ncbi:MAG TPA: ATP-binding protein, partial [Burkholderiales bacterium]
VDVRGEILELKDTINTMVDQLNAFASEVSRVAREVGTEGKLGGQAQVPGVAGTWKDLTDNVNLMAANLTGQVRGIANIVTAVANGDLDHKLVFEAKGEIAALADTINSMIDTLATFAEQVTNVAREVGVEGKLGGQAKVPGAAGLWRGLTDNVNQLAAHLTAQVRAIAEVATAVAQGDLTRSIMVDAHGEVAALKDNINEMIRNLADTTRKNIDQDWLKTNLANFSRTLQGHRSLVAASKQILTELAPLVNAQQGVVYVRNVENDDPRLDLVAAYACNPAQDLPETLRFHENLIGQCAFEKKRILLKDVPADYLTVRSALGASVPLSVIIMPVLFESEVKAVIELASFRHFSETHLSFLEQLTGSIGIIFNTIEATMRTEHLLAQSQSLTVELQTKQEELQRTNQQLQEKATQLSEQMKQVEYKGKEVELAKAALEEKAEQLVLSSRYKSEFLANMSHELRTPLNSLLILAQLLAESPASNLTPKQIEYAQTIYAAGNDLLALINDVLDLAKVESGTVTLNIATERFAELRDYLERAFRQVGQDKGLQFGISMDRGLPSAIRTDAKRLRQILKNLLSNAFKFTATGAVSLEVAMVTEGWTPGHMVLSEAGKVVAFSVVDTGIGISADKQQIIFEAFRQADGTTSRQFGGTGLGLSISASLAHLLGGEIKVQSTPGKGSTFTLYLPLVAGTNGGNFRLADSSSVDPVRGPMQAALDDVSQLSQNLAGDLPPMPVGSPPGAGNAAPELAGRKVLLVDDDIRSVFALTSALERQAMIVTHAENGADAIEMLKNNPQVDIILMDMMMPGLDGYSTIRVIRGLERFRSVPIIGVSAKAMKGDGMKAIDAGASDYISKPVDLDSLLALIRASLSG